MEYAKINIPEHYDVSGLVDDVYKEVITWEEDERNIKKLKEPLLWHSDEDEEEWCAEQKLSLRDGLSTNVKWKTSYRVLPHPWSSKFLSGYIQELVYPLQWVMFWNIYNPGYFQGVHTHGGSTGNSCLFAGVFYVKNPTPTSFYDPGMREVKPKVSLGDFLIFDADVFHSVPLVEKERITIGVNMWPSNPDPFCRRGEQKKIFLDSLKERGFQFCTLQPE